MSKRLSVLKKVLKKTVLLPLLLMVLLTPGVWAGNSSIRLNGVIEGVDRDQKTLLIDSYVVHPPKRIRGSIRKFKDIKVGHFAKLYGHVRSDGSIKASYLYTRHKVPGHVHKKELFKLSSKESGKIQKEGKLYTGNEAIVSFVQNLGQRLVPEYARSRFDFKFHVIEDKEVNAFAYPNGHIFIHTGLLGRVKNEAQLASVMGHEIAHVTEGHGQRNLKSSRWKGIAAAVGAVTLLVLTETDEISKTEGTVAGVGLMLGYMAATNGYGRNLEDQSDRVGLRYMKDAGYDPRQAPDVWNMFNIVYGDTPKALNIFYGNHSTNKLRKKNQKDELKIHYQKLDASGLRVNENGYQKLMVNLMRESAVHDYEKKRYAAAEVEFNRVLSVIPEDSVSLEHLKKIHAKQNGQ